MGCLFPAGRAGVSGNDDRVERRSYLTSNCCLSLGATMSWNRNDAATRIRNAFFQLSDLQLLPLAREMNLHGLARNQCRVVAGVHLYLSPTNFGELLQSAREDSGRLAKLLRH